MISIPTIRRKQKKEEQLLTPPIGATNQRTARQIARVLRASSTEAYPQ